MLWPFARPQTPLPAVEEPTLPKNERGYVKRVMEESKSFLDADASGFETIAAAPGWSVLKKPVEGTKVRASGWDSMRRCFPQHLFLHSNGEKAGQTLSRARASLLMALHAAARCCNPFHPPAQHPNSTPTTKPPAHHVAAGGRRPHEGRRPLQAAAHNGRQAHHRPLPSGAAL